MTEQYGPQYQQPLPPQQGWIQQQAPLPPPKKKHPVRNTLIVIGSVILLAIVLFLSWIMWVWNPNAENTTGSLPTQSFSKALTAQGGMSTPAFESYATEGDSCTAAGGYSDIAAGVQITVSNAEDKQIGFGDLQSGLMSEGKCRFAFEIGDIPKGESVYKFGLGDRGEVSYHESDLRNGTIELKIGE